MAYSSKFVLSVLCDGEIQKEFSDGVVSLPLESSYGIRLRNKHDRRAMVQVFIDGENVSGGGFIVGAKDRIDIFRSAERDAAFKFVSLDSLEAQDFGKSDNKDRSKGVIEARFYLEKVPSPMVLINHYPSAWLTPVWSMSINPHPGNLAVASTDYTASNMATCSTGLIPKVVSPEVPLTIGCTVEGEKTGLSYRETAFIAESDYVTLKVVLRGVSRKETPLVNFCVGCGIKRQPNSRFCGQCGQKF